MFAIGVVVAGVCAAGSAPIARADDPTPTIELLREGSTFSYSQAFAADASTVAWPDTTGITVRAIATGAEHSIDPSFPGSAGTRSLFLSPDGGRLTVEVSYTDGSLTLCRPMHGMSTGTSLSNLLAANQQMACSGNFAGGMGQASPNGRWLTAIVYTDGIPALHAIDTTAGTANLILPVDPNVTTSVSFPDGGSTGVAVNAQTGEGYIVHGDGSAPTPLPDDFVYGFSGHSWAASGELVAAPAGQGSTGGVVIIDVTTPDVISFIPDANAGGNSGAFSEDGSRFGYWKCIGEDGCTGGNPRGALWATDVDGSNNERVSPTELGLNAGYVLWVGDGFVSAAFANAGQTIWTFDADGSNFRTLISDSDDLTIGAYSMVARGERLIFVGWGASDFSSGHAAAWSVSRDGAGLTRLIPAGAEYRELAWLGGASSDAQVITGVMRMDSSYQVFAAGVGSLPPPPAQGPVLFIHGIDAFSPYGDDCAVTWDDAKSFLRAHGFADRDLLTVAYYEQDANCDRPINTHSHPQLGNAYFDASGTHAGSNGGHTAEAQIEHLGYHLAWFVYDEYSSRGVPVDILAHSMGGLIARYALAEVAANNSAFPPRLLVTNAVTFGTPHGGARLATLCAAVRRLRQCSEMRAGSAFLTGLEQNGWNPQGDGGTDWTVMGTDDDTAVAADRAVGTSRNGETDLYFGACHKVRYPSVRRVGRVRYDQGIEHGEFMHDGTIAGGMNATNLATRSSAGHCGAPLEALQNQRHPMGQAALALSSSSH